MLGWSPLWESIIESSIWREPDHVLRLWVFFLARKDRDGFVPYRSPAVMADITKIVDVRKYEEALGRLMAPDPNSTTAACGGRRIIGVDGGWRIVNHELYRDKINKEYRREYQRIKQAEYRAKLKEASRKPVRRGKPTAAEAVAGKVLAGGGTVEEAEAAVDGMRPGEWPAGHKHDPGVLGDGGVSADGFGAETSATGQDGGKNWCPVDGMGSGKVGVIAGMEVRESGLTETVAIPCPAPEADAAAVTESLAVEPETNADDGERDPFKEDGE